MKGEKRCCSDGSVEALRDRLPPGRCWGSCRRRWELGEPAKERCSARPGGGGGHRCACRPEPGQQRLALPQTGSKRTRLLPPLFLAALQQVASQAVKARPPSFSMGTFQGTPSSFSPMAAPGSAASPGSSAFPNLPGRGVGFSECSEGGWGGSGQPS